MRRSILFAAALTMAWPAFAHHGPGTFALGKTVSFTGARLTKVEMLNPHGWLYFETTEPDGTWEVEDPIYLKGKATGRDVPVMPADAPYAEDTCKEQGFIDYSKQTSRK